MAEELATGAGGRMFTVAGWSREGRSMADLQAPYCIQAFKYPHSMGAWSKDSQTHAASPKEGSSRLSKIEDSGFGAPCTVRMETVAD